MKMLFLDGGGCFGKAQAKILWDAACFDKFDCYAGTSIGSALVASLALGLQANLGTKFFDEWMPVVFKRGWLRAMFSYFVPRYPDDGLNEALQTVFGSVRFGDARKPLFVTAVDIGRKTIKVFDSTNFDDARLPMWEVVRTATAAETYFAPWKGMADGGMLANNPSMVGVAAASRVLKVPMSEMEVLSIGTGRSTEDGHREPRSRLQWGRWTVDALLEGAADDMHDYFVRSVPLRKYIRIQFLRELGWKMSRPADMNKAMVKWDSDILAATAIVRGF